MKPITNHLVRYIQLGFIFTAVIAAGVFMSESSLSQKARLDEKKHHLQKQNAQLALEIKALERRITLMRSDQKTIEKVAKRKLGMIRPDETVYIFDSKRLAAGKAINPEYGLDKDSNMP